ncbi:MAG: type II secretion system protein [Candidatus Gastranaerophilales bacterium]|nr:type II secretion system protein [Candidatus Gastranaerophilales bacterium]
MMNKKGFTLAEVLITLLIVGVISSIVIPALISNTQDAELKTAWKKAYSDISLATKSIMNDNAGTMKGLCTTTGDQICLRDKYLQYLNSIKTCTPSTIAGNCWHTDSTLLQSWYTINGDDAGFILNNGMLVTFDLNAAMCDSTYIYPEHCGTVTVDINGFKGPNKEDKDIFVILINANNIKPDALHLPNSSKYLYQ